MDQYMESFANGMSTWMLKWLNAMPGPGKAPWSPSSRQELQRAKPKNLHHPGRLFFAAAMGSVGQLFVKDVDADPHNQPTSLSTKT